MPVDIGDPHALGALDDLGCVGLLLAGMAHRVPKMAGVHFTQEVVVFHGGLRADSGNLIKSCHHGPALSRGISPGHARVARLFQGQFTCSSSLSGWPTTTKVSASGSSRSRATRLICSSVTAIEAMGPLPSNRSGNAPVR